jgi:glycerate 2-kinase
VSGEPGRLRMDLASIVRAGIEGVEPGRLAARALEGDEGIHGTEAVRVLCAGKASAAMAAGAVRMLGHRIASGLIVSPERIDPPAPFEMITGGHPLPTVESERAGRRALALAESVQPGERLLCLLSGGASALMAVPASGVSLEDKKDTTSQLLRAGADITVLNCVRKHLSGIKGGGLALRSVSGCHTLAISDVVGDDLAVIGSGPGVPDASRYADALDALREFGGLDAYPAAVVERLRAGARGDVPETLKPSDARASRATAAVIGSRRDAMDAASAAARRLGYNVVRVDRPIVGEARQAAIDYVREISSRIASRDVPVCIVSSGETTVRVTGTGRGGRNQEFALAAAGELAGFGPGVVLASVGTDGIDGPTDAAGAVVDGGTIERARRLGLDPVDVLHRNDSYTFFEALGDLVVIGRTGTNVGDLQVLLAGRTSKGE